MYYLYKCATLKLKVKLDEICSNRLHWIMHPLPSYTVTEGSMFRLVEVVIRASCVSSNSFRMWKAPIDKNLI